MSYLPEQLITSLQQVADFDEQAFRRVHEESMPRTSVRFNHRKLDRNIPDPVSPDLILPQLDLAQKIPWSAYGYYLKERPLFYLDPLWHAGAYYVQEPSSMSLEFALNNVRDISRPLRILDLCAAPGGKSTLLADLMSPGSLLISNEVIASRAKILEENIIKWGNPNVIVTQNDARDFNRIKNFFDVILVDAPCSGSGLFRKDPEALNEWSPEQVAYCAKRQKRILADVLPALKQNGLLLYSTCSFSPEENEDIADYMANELALENISIPFKKEWGIVESGAPVSRAKGYRFYPDKVNGEGFFLACFQKKNMPAIAEQAFKIKPVKNGASLPPNYRKLIEPWMAPTDDLYLFSWKNTLWAIPQAIRWETEGLFAHLKIVSAGINLGKVVRDQFIPDHALAMSARVNKDSLINLPEDEAVRYLRKEAIAFPGFAKGWQLAGYNNYPLGWLKGLGTRTNNYYPMNWRIRKKNDS